MELTVTIHFTRAILKTLEAQAAQLPEEVHAWLAQYQGHERLPLSALDALWQACVASSADPLFGLRAGLNVQPGNLDVVGFLLMSCETLEDALDALIDYHRIVGEGGDFTFTQQADECRLIYAPHYDTCRDQRVSAVMGSTLAVTRWLTGGAFSAKRVSFAHPAPHTSAKAEALMGCPITYDQVADVMAFDAKMLTLPVVQANAQVFERMRVLADEALERLKASSFSRDVSELIRANPAASKEEIAEQLHMSGRHLNRKLGLEGGSFKLLQDSVRCQLAEQQIDGGVHAMDIAEQLGFSDERSFAKAFKRWRDMTPAQFKGR